MIIKKHLIKQGAKAVMVGKNIYELDEHAQRRNKSDLSFLQNIPMVQSMPERELAAPLYKTLNGLGLTRMIYCKFAQNVSDDTNEAPPILLRYAATSKGILVSIINVGTKPVSFKLVQNSDQVHTAQDLFTGNTINVDTIKLQPCGVSLLRVGTK